MNPSAAAQGVHPTPVLGALAALAHACGRDLRLAMRSKAELALIVVFFVLVMTLFPLGVSPEPKLLERIAPGIAWVAALLASLLSLPRLFAIDHADGTLEQLVLAPAELPAVVAGKVLAHWMTNGLPLVLLAPLAGLQLGMSPQATITLVAGLALGTPSLSWLGAVCAALTLGTRAGSALLALRETASVPAANFQAGDVLPLARGSDWLGVLCWEATAATLDQLVALQRASGAARLRVFCHRPTAMTALLRE